MQGQNHSYLDISVIPELRTHVLSQDCVVLFRNDLKKILWANAAGAQLFGSCGVKDLLAANLTESQAIVRQLKNSINQMEHETPIMRGFRVNQGLRSLLVQFEITKIPLPGDDYGYKVVNIPEVMEKVNENTLAAAAVKTLEGFADAAAILDDYGLPLAASQNFQDMVPSEDTLETLITELKDQDDKLIKRPEADLAGNIIAIGLARIADNPGRNLIVLADTQTKAEEAPDTSPSFIEEHKSPTHHDLPDNDVTLNLDSEEASLIAEEDDQHAFHTEDKDDLSNLVPAVEEFDEVTAGMDEDIDDIPSAKSDAQDSQQQDSSSNEFDKNEGTVRFAWLIDKNCIFQSISPELSETVGKNAAAIEGRKWRDVANVFGFDTDGEIETLINKQDTWSGKTVLWPVQGTDMVLPIDLAALPSFNANREFEGFRGFGVIRTADAILDPEETGIILAMATEPVEEEHDAADKSDEEHNIEQDNVINKDKPETDTNIHPLDNPQDDEAASNIVQLTPNKIQPVEKGLSKDESKAFRKIGDTLREDRLSSRQTSAPATNPRRPEEPTPKFKPEQLDTSIMENLPVAIMVYNSDELLFANPSLFKATGYDTLQELSDAGGVQSLLNPPIDEADKTHTGHFLITKSGERKPINPVLHTVPWLGEKALLISFATPNEPIVTEPDVLEISSVSEIQNILDTTSDGIILLEPDGEIISINASAEALFGKSFDAVKGKNVSYLFAPENKETITHYIKSLLSPGVDRLLNDGQEVIAAEASGGMIPVFLNISVMDTSGKLCAVLRDMTAWKKTEEELVQSRSEAEEVSKQKSDFLAHVSHEIRTPLNAIIGFSEIMLEERFGAINNERYMEYLRDIKRSGGHVLDLINDLLSLSKIEAGKLELEFEAIELNQLVAESVALLQPQANTKRIIIRTSLSRAVPKVVADSRSIKQIILNLVSNAIKYSPSNTQVIVSTLYESNGEVAMRIRDTGQGMSKNEIEEALKPFHQVHRITDKSGEGTGLGLPLTKALIEANRALFDLESEPGQGTIAHVQFPTQRVLAD